MPLPRGCITGAEGCVLVVNAVDVGPSRKTNCNNYARLHRVCFYLSPFRPSDTQQGAKCEIYFVGDQGFKSVLQSSYCQKFS